MPAFRVCQAGRKNASTSGTGSQQEPFRAISRAAAVAGPGDTVIVHAGIYRECVAPGQGGEEGMPVVYMAAPGERVVIRRSEIWQPKKVIRHPDGTMEGGINEQFFAGLRINPYKTALKAAPDGKQLTIAIWRY